MNEYRKNNNCDVESLSRPVPSRPSLFEALDKAKAQIDYTDFIQTRKNGKTYIDPLIDEICLIIAEVFVRSPESVMRIRGTEIETRIVQEVYGKLTYDHIELVYSNFRQQTHIIRKKSAYLQTALYNSVFELESHCTNLYSVDFR